MRTMHVGAQCIEPMRQEAVDAGDLVMVVICDVALGHIPDLQGLDEDEIEELTEQGYRNHDGTWSRDTARENAIEMCMNGQQWAARVASVEGGYICFESPVDYDRWMAQR